MENIKSNKKQNSFMSKINIFAILFIALISTSFAEHDSQEYFLDWSFEEGIGSVTFDSSENSLIGVLSGSYFYNTGTIPFGSNTIAFEGTNDIILTQLPTSFSSMENFSISVWVYPETTATDTIYTIYSTDSNIELKLEFDADRTPTTLNLEGVDNLLNSFGYTLDTTDFPINNWYNLQIVFDLQNQEIIYYRDGNLISTIATSDLSFNTNENHLLQLGLNKNDNQDFFGVMDEFKILNFQVNQSQVDEIYSENEPTFQVHAIDIDTESTSIFTSYTPNQSANLSGETTFTFELNTPSECILYVNDIIEKEFEESILNTYTTILPSGTNSYMLYCSYIENETQFFELTERITFEVSENDPQKITFQFIGNDFDINEESLILHSPCMEEGHSAIGLEDFKPYRAKYNLGGITFAPLENGIATITTNVGANEFCLYNGRVLYSEADTKVFDYDIVEVNGFLELGQMNIPNNVSSIYQVKVDKFEIYDKLDPKAWGETWASVIGGLILGLIGFFTLMAGIGGNNGKIVVIGGLLLLSALGISFNGVLGLVL